jgi:hypothetical protein
MKQKIESICDENGLVSVLVLDLFKMILIDKGKFSKFQFLSSVLSLCIFTPFFLLPTLYMFFFSLSLIYISQTFSQFLSLSFSITISLVVYQYISVCVSFSFSVCLFLSIYPFFMSRNVCREIGLLISFVYFFGRVAHHCVSLPPGDAILAQPDCPLNDVIFCLHEE